MSHGARRQQFAAASRFWSIPNLMPRSTVTRVWLTEWAHLGQLLYTDIWQSFFFFFFFFFCRFVSVVWQDSDRVQSVTQGTWYSGRSSMLSSDSWLIDIGERSHPTPMHRMQFVVPARLPKPVIGSAGLSSSRFDDDVPEVNCTWTASFSWRVKEVALWFESHDSKNLTGGTTWSSQSTSTDWLTRTHHWSSPRSKLAYKKPTSTRKLRKFPVTSGQGSKHRVWTASRWWARWRSQSSSCQHHVTTWRGLIPADHEYLDSVAWPCQDCEVAPVWHHDVTNPRTCQFCAVCLTVFPFEFRPRTFTIGFYGKNSIISELMILECSFPLIFFLPSFFELWFFFLFVSAVRVPKVWSYITKSSTWRSRCQVYDNIRRTQDSKRPPTMKVTSTFERFARLSFTCSPFCTVLALGTHCHP